MITFEELLRYTKVKKFHPNEEKTNLDNKVEEFLDLFPDFKSIVGKLLSSEMSDSDIKRIKVEFDKLMEKIVNSVENNNDNNNVFESDNLIVNKEDISPDKETDNNNLHLGDEKSDNTENLLDYQDNFSDKPIDSNLDDMSYIQEDNSSNIIEPVDDNGITDEQQEEYVQQFINTNDNNNSLISPTVDYSSNTKIESENDLSSYDTTPVNEMSDMFTDNAKSYDDDMKGYIKHNDRPKIKTLAMGDNNKGFTSTLFIILLGALSGLIIFLVNAIAK